jgi:hypothetical protein
VQNVVDRRQPGSQVTRALEEPLGGDSENSASLQHERQWVRIFRGGRNPIDSAGLIAKTLSGSIACG